MSHCGNLFLQPFSCMAGLFLLTKHAFVKSLLESSSKLFQRDFFKGDLYALRHYLIRSDQDL